MRPTNKPRTPGPSRLTISVVIPSLDEFAALPRLLKDIETQTLRPDEVIVAEGGDVKRMRRLLDESLGESHRVCVVRGGSPAKARNIGAARARGDLLVFLDADVRLPPRFFEDAVAEMRRRRLHLTSPIQSPSRPLLSYRLIYAVLNGFTRVGPFFFPVATGTCILCERHAFRAVQGFDERITLAEDAAFAKAAVKAGYRYRMLRSVTIVADTRRFDERGLFRTLRQIVGVTLYRFFVGEDYENRFRYEFGHR